MSRARHAKGGGIGIISETEKKPFSYSGTGSPTEKEALKRKSGGKVVKGNMPTMVHGKAPRHHGNRPGRKAGGSVGADTSPMTHASKLTHAEGMSIGYKVDKEDD